MGNFRFLLTDCLPVGCGVPVGVVAIVFFVKFP